MRWQGRRQSGNVEDRRGRPGGMIAGGGLGTIVILIAIWALGGNPLQFLAQIQGGGGGAPRVASKEEEDLKQFVAVVVADTEDVWNHLFPAQLNRPYEEPSVVLFTDRVRTGCGFASAAVGPFYCPADRKAYFDLAFFDELKRRFQAPGDFAVAYVVAHEIAHHVQTLTGISDQVHQAQQGAGELDRNRLSVRLELQADFLAGVWAHHAQRSKKILEEGDLKEALDAAAAVGDDAIQRKATGEVQPDAFTHGKSEQRIRWFRRGFETGDLSQMNRLFEIAYEGL